MTIKDLAKLTNTSPATVSLALNGKAGVSGTTRERIIKAAEENGYILPKRTAALPSSIIRLVAVSKPNTSGIHNFRTTFFAEIINYIQTRCSELNYSMIYSMVPHSDFLQSILNLETIQPSCGIIVLGTYLESSEVPLLQQLPVPFVLLDRNCTIHNLNSVSINNFSGAYLAVEKLISCCHTRIGHIGGRTTSYPSYQRFEGYSRAMTDAGLRRYVDRYTIMDNTNREEARAAAKKLLAKKNRPTAIFCANDSLAFGVCAAVSDVGLRVPNDVSVVGYDDIAMASTFEPKLTTIHQPIYEMGRRSIQLMLHQTQSGGTGIPESVVLSASLVKRESVRNLV